MSTYREVELLRRFPKYSIQLGHGGDTTYISLNPYRKIPNKSCHGSQYSLMNGLILKTMTEGIGYDSIRDVTNF